MKYLTLYPVVELATPPASRNRLSRLTCCLLAAIVTIATAGSMHGQAPGSTQLDEASQLKGSWVFSSVFPGGVFTSLASFTAGGVFTGTGSNDRVMPVSELHGRWDRIKGNQTFSVTARLFAFAPANANGPAIAMLKSNMVLQLKGKNELVGVANLYTCDVHGNNCLAAPGLLTISGRRMTPETTDDLAQLLPPE